jgi:UDP-galactopyranose mutase
VKNIFVGGARCSGSVIARGLVNNNFQFRIIDKCNHTIGNVFDIINEEEIMQYVRVTE